MRRVIGAVLVGLAVGVVLFFGFVFHTWTAIHSGWSERGIRNFYTAMWAVPLIAGAFAGWLAFQVASRRRRWQR